VECEKEEMSFDSSISLKSQIDNSKCQLAADSLIIRIFRILKYRMDMQHASQEHILRTVLCEKRLPGVPAFAKEREQQGVRIKLDMQNVPNQEFAEALETAKVDLL
jgi:hypothetical protein